jgi:hypothetical protein
MSFPEVPQASVLAEPPSAIAGMIADSGFGYCESVVLDSAADAGLAIVDGANGPDSGKLPGQSSDVTNLLRGFSVYNPMIEPRTPRFAAKDCISVKRRGRIWVQVHGDVTRGPFYVVHSGADAGKIRGDNTGATLCPSAKVIVAAAAGGVAQIEVNLP